MFESNDRVWDYADKKAFCAEWERVRVAILKMLKGYDLPITCPDPERHDEQPHNIEGFRIIWAETEKKQEQAFFGATEFNAALAFFKSLDKVLYKSFEPVYI